MRLYVVYGSCKRRYARALRGYTTSSRWTETEVRDEASSALCCAARVDRAATVVAVAGPLL
eukprot:scaffold909_cov575-Prasinococcus_capsulatus_cf.AAC.4